jgi:diguanylate cyclase (GGDEF)-like protein
MSAHSSESPPAASQSADLEEAARLRAVAGQLARYVPPLTPDTRCDLARETFARDAGLFSLPVVHPSGEPLGLLNRFKFFEQLSTRFGRELAHAKPVSLFMEGSALVLDEGTNIDELGSLLLDRQHQYVFDGFMVTRDGRYVGVGTGLDLIRALTERRHAELQRMALHDMLTGLPNRQLFEERLAGVLAEVRDRERVAVLFVDFDRFKAINDTYGHRFGDLVLCGVSQRLRAALRRSDIVARLSGDEFAIVLPGVTTPGDAEGVARVLVASCSSPLAVDGREVIVSCSIGLALYPDDASGADELLRAADAAQYRAKEVRNTWQRYSAEMEQWRSSLPGLEALRHALDHGELAVHYQPIANLSTGRVTGVEALVRWSHPTLGAVPAIDIVRIAEESGLIVQLSEFVIRTAMRQVLVWDRETGRTDLSLAVNISAVQIHEGGLVTMLDRLVAETGFTPERLELEITETSAMRASSSTLATLHALKARGFTLTIDDFGTAYSALSRLERLPIDGMKIDRSFLQGIGEEARGGVIARAIIAMGHSLGLRLVGEGVETDQQLSFLLGEGCDCMQGFLLARPMPASEVTPILTRDHRGARGTLSSASPAAPGVASTPR